MRNKGQMLIELVVGIAVIIVVLIAVVSLSTQTVKTSRVSGNRGEATALADKELELVRKDRDNDSAAFFVLSGARECLSGAEPQEGYTCESDYVNTAGDQMAVAVRIGWSDGSVTIQTELTKQ
jgi:type II secretory pathway pseudopilin PulG